MFTGVLLSERAIIRKEKITRNNTKSFQPNKNFKPGIEVNKSVENNENSNTETNNSIFEVLVDPPESADSLSLAISPSSSIVIHCSSPNSVLKLF